MKRIGTIIYWMGIYYRWPFWKMIREGNEFSLSGRGWLHTLKDVLLFPIWLLMALCAGVLAIFESNAYKKTMHLKDGEKISPALKRYIKVKLLER